MKSKMSRRAMISLILLSTIVATGQIQSISARNIWVRQFGTPVPLLTNLNHPADLYVDSLDRIYFIGLGDGTLNSWNRLLSTPRVLATGLQAGYGIYVRGSKIYYTDWNAHTLNVLRKGSTTPQILLSGLTSPDGCAVDTRGNIYWVDGADGTLNMLPAGSTTYVTLFTGLSNPFGVDVDLRGNIYYTEGAGTLSVLKKGATSPTLLLSGLSTPEAIAVDRWGNVFFGENGQGSVCVLYRGAHSKTVIASRGVPAEMIGLAVDIAGNVYYTVYEASATIWKIPAI